MKDFHGTLVAHQVFCMSMRGETWSALGTLSPSGVNRKLTFAPHGVFVTSAKQVLKPPSAAWQ